LLVFLGARELEQLAAVRQGRAERTQCVDDLLQRGAFPAEALGALGVRPDGGILELALDLLEPFALELVVKDTP
jgi:hypothetical protein